MSVLNKETRNIQNPALGAAALWRFTAGYAEGSRVENPTPIPLLFLVLPIAFHQETAKFVTSTQRLSGLRGFVNKFADSRNAKNDLILSLHSRSLTMRRLTTQSLSLAISSKLIALDAERGVAFPLSTTPAKTGIPQSVRSMLSGVEKLGFWCSQVSLHEISIILKVAF